MYYYISLNRPGANRYHPDGALFIVAADKPQPGYKNLEPSEIIKFFFFYVEEEMPGCDIEIQNKS